jgi:hypothetical protein
LGIQFGEFLCSTAEPFLRPDLSFIRATSAAAVKAGRRDALAASSAMPGPRLDGREQGAKLCGSGGLVDVRL